MRDKIKNVKVFSIVFVIVLIILGIIYYEFKTQNIGYYNTYSNEEVIKKYNKQIENVKEGLEVGQTFISQDNNLGKIYIKFNTMTIEGDESQKTGGYALIGLRDGEGTIIKEEEIPYNYIRTNSKYCFKIPIQEDSENKEYYLYIKFLELPEYCTNFFSINYSDEDVYESGSMYINGEKKVGDIFFYEFYFNPASYKLIIILALMLIIVFGILAYFIYINKKITAEKLFLFLMPILLLITLVLMPTFKNHDESFHWYRIYDITQREFFY